MLEVLGIRCRFPGVADPEDVIANRHVTHRKCLVHDQKWLWLLLLNDTEAALEGYKERQNRNHGAQLPSPGEPLNLLVRLHLGNVHRSSLGMHRVPYSLSNHPVYSSEEQTMLLSHHYLIASRKFRDEPFTAQGHDFAWVKRIVGVE